MQKKLNSFIKMEFGKLKEYKYIERLTFELLKKLPVKTTEFHQSLIGGMSSARKPTIIGGIRASKTT